MNLPAGRTAVRAADPDVIGAGSGDAVRCPLPPATPGATVPTPAVYKVLEDGGCPLALPPPRR